MPGTFSWPLAARGKPRRGMLRRAVFSDIQRKALEKMFQKQKYISKPDRKKLASKLGLKDSQVNMTSRYGTTHMRCEACETFYGGEKFCFAQKLNVSVPISR